MVIGVRPLGGTRAALGLKDRLVTQEELETVCRLEAAARLSDNGWAGSGC